MAALSYSKAKHYACSRNPESDRRPEEQRRNESWSHSWHLKEFLSWYGWIKSQLLEVLRLQSGESGCKSPRVQNYQNEWVLWDGRYFVKTKVARSSWKSRIQRRRQTTAGKDAGFHWLESGFIQSQSDESSIANNRLAQECYSVDLRTTGHREDPHDHWNNINAPILWSWENPRVCAF